jgi:exopolysaccharide production protein ExoQ
MMISGQMVDGVGCAPPPSATSAAQIGRPPWLVFVFLTIVFFFVYHDIATARDGYYPSQDELAAAVAEGSASRRIALLALGAFAMVSLIRQRAGGRIRINGALGFLVVGFAGLAFVSPVWAEDRLLSLTRVAVLAILCIAALAITLRYSLREIILWALFSSGAYVALGILLELIFGNFHPLASGYRFAGTLHPNSQGINCAILLLSAVATADLEKTGRMFFRICAVVGFVFLALTASRTAFAAALVALALYGGVMWSRRSKLAIAYALSVAFCLVGLILGDAFWPILKSAAMLGREDSSGASFNGRIGVWDEIGPYVQRRPILGYGYGGFWTPSRITEISEGEKWGIPNSHSAYLDNLLALGAVGLLTYVFLLLFGIRRAFRFLRVSGDPAYAFCGALLVFCAIDGFLETAAANPSLPMLLCLVVLTHLVLKSEPRGYQFDPLYRGAAIPATAR